MDKFQKSAARAGLLGAVVCCGLFFRPAAGMAAAEEAAALPGGVSQMLQDAQKEDDTVEGEILWESETDPFSEPDGTFRLDEEYIESYGSLACSDIIFYGDSRVVGMSRSIGGYHYVGREGAGYDWMQGEGAAYLEAQMSENPDADVVFCFGVNDPGNIDAYIAWYRAFQEKHSERRIWFLSVNPVYDGISAENGYNARNTQVTSFNEALQQAFPDRYLDSWGYLEEYGYNAPDGVHYDGDTYFAIQNYTWRAITQKLDEEAESGK